MVVSDLLRAAPLGRGADEKNSLRRNWEHSVLVNIVRSHAEKIRWPGKTGVRCSVWRSGTVFGVASCSELACGKVCSFGVIWMVLQATFMRCQPLEFWRT